MNKISVFKFCLFTAMVYCAILSIGGIARFVDSVLQGDCITTWMCFAILATIEVVCTGFIFDLYQSID